jgi:transposase
MRYIQGNDRDQMILLPEILDDYITENNPIRFIDAYVENLDMNEFDFTHSTTKETGRKPYNPSDLLRLYIYGYLNRIRSSRCLEQSTYRNIEIIWLMKKLHPDFKTIADFRKDNTNAIKKVCRDFTLLCKKLNLFGCELIAIDGSKFSASNSNSRSFTKDKLKKLIKTIDGKIDDFLKKLDDGDKTEESVPDISLSELNDKIEQLKKRKNEYENLQSRMEQTGEDQISLSDPDSRLMTTAKGKDVAYNVQIVTDEKHKLIVTHEVTNCGADQNQLHKMASPAKKVLEVNHIAALGDAVYWSRESIKQCHDDHIETYVPHPIRSCNKKKGLYTKTDFKYDPQSDSYQCPAGQKLTFRGLRVASGKPERKYMTDACKTCSSRTRCTVSKGKRYINRWIHEEVMEQLDERVKTNPDKMRLRKAIVEHPFGTIKHWMGYRHFLTRGMNNVSAEMDLFVLAYNLKRVLNIVNFKELMLAIQ